MEEQNITTIEDSISTENSQEKYRKTTIHKKRHKVALKESFIESCFKAFVAVCAFCVVCLGIYGVWTHHQLNRFRNNVQEILDSGKGLEALKRIDDWRVDDITETTKRVSRADGHYVLMVWYLSDGKYLIEAVEK